MIILPYTLLALTVMLPLLAPGFILTLDMVFVPHPPLPADVTSSYLFHAALTFLSYVIPGDILQKLILFGTLILAGIGMHVLVESFKIHGSASARWGAYVAGVVYVINPFVYGRFMAGQYAVLLGYALLPFFVRALLKFLTQPTMRNMAVLMVWVLAISIVSIHTLGLVAMIVSVAVSVAYWQHRREKQYLLDVFRSGVLGFSGFVLLSSYWLLPTLLGHSRIAESVSSFSAVDRQAFATDGGLFSVLQLHGFWAEAQGLFTATQNPLPLSGLWQVCLFAVIATGIVSAWRHRRALAVTFGIAGILSAVFAVGGPLNQWLVVHVPLFAGYREPHKFAALLALVYAVFAAIGAVAIISKAQSGNWGKYAGALLVLLPFFVTPTMIWGFNGQLKPVQYPRDWSAMNERLSRLPQDEKVLFLPWHLYMKYGFTNRIIASPADKFFSASVIQSNDPEFAGVLPPYDATKSKLGSEILPQGNHSNRLGAQLKTLNIQYVLLAKETDYKSYAYLDRQADLKLVTETPTLKLYRNTAVERPDHAND